MTTKKVTLVLIVVWMKVFKFHPLPLPSPITIFEYDIKIIRKVRKKLKFVLHTLGVR